MLAIDVPVLACQTQNPTVNKIALLFAKWASFTPNVLMHVVD